MSLFKNEKIATPTIYGVQDASTAASGVVGEVLSSLVAVGSAVSLTTATAANVTSLALTPGDWDIVGRVNFTGGSTTVAAAALYVAGINTTSATVPTDGSEAQVAMPALTTTSFKGGVGSLKKTLSVSANTTVYLVTQGAFSAGTLGAYGSLIARRVR